MSQNLLNMCQGAPQSLLFQGRAHENFYREEKDHTIFFNFVTHEMQRNIRRKKVNKQVKRGHLATGDAVIGNRMFV